MEAEVTYFKTEVKFPIVHMQCHCLIQNFPLHELDYGV